jgi:hypothetical protein
MAIFWTNVQVDVQTSLATAKTITGITKANPGVVTSAAHGYTAGDYIVLTVAGMVELNGIVARVATAATDTFQLEGIDTTLFNTFTSGSAQKITFGQSMTTAQDISVSGGEPEFADITTIHDTLRKRTPTVKSPMSISMNSLFAPSDAALTELRAADRAITTRAVRLRFASGEKIVFNSYVSAPGVPTGQAGQAVQTPVAFEVQGIPTVYST